MSATRSGSPRAPAARGAAGEPTTAFVLSGGASLGALQVGMLQALYERGIVPDLLVATSVGALNGAFVASRPQGVATARMLGQVWRNLQREDMFPVSMTALIGGFCGRRNRLVPDRGLRHLVRRHVEFQELADAVIPLHLVAFDLIEGREARLSEGPAVEAIAAAASIPGIFPPVEIADRYVIDGGVVNNTPISHAVELGAERIFVLPTRDLGSIPARPPETALDTTIYGLGLLIDGRLQSDIARYSRDVEIVILPAANSAGATDELGAFDRLIKQALIAARAVLARDRAGRHLQLVSSRPADAALANTNRAPRMDSRAPRAESRPSLHRRDTTHRGDANHAHY